MENPNGHLPRPNSPMLWLQELEHMPRALLHRLSRHGPQRVIRFDGLKGVLAHSFASTDGRFHYDGAENWVVAAKDDAFDLGTVALHEIGHLLGLQLLKRP
ncbi:hypothetical protein CRYUN_Cryun10bG0168600 [Craigia yunnanensis]